MTEQIIENEAIYYIWRCKETTELRGKRTSVKTGTPCGRWNFLTTTRSVTPKSAHQGYCKCGFRPRLKPKDVEQQDSDVDAHNEAVRRNKKAARGVQ